jgi:MFS transporter
MSGIGWASTTVRSGKSNYSERPVVLRPAKHPRCVSAWAGTRLTVAAGWPCAPARYQTIRDLTRLGIIPERHVRARPTSATGRPRTAISEVKRRVVPPANKLGELHQSEGEAQILLARFNGRPVVLSGLATFVVALALVVAGLSAASIVLFVVGTVVGGVGVGAIFPGSLSTANRLAPPAQRGQVLSTLFVFCYIGLAIPVIGVGFASADVGDFRAVLVCAIVLAAVSVMSMTGIRRAAPAR